ncbi:hypothetical protein PROFUN_02645 [Planoprotostelium fungivorum]|uniref:Uncharacterized protein n=1 Tax=Planoprotostelium fungivorum TaxID=1890364 RepID=A0A2P6NVM4_9EUKA|nr:hypothetical protein PROFUN_02645 [Planoprotostelium fungivorum]
MEPASKIKFKFLTPGMSQLNQTQWLLETITRNKSSSSKRAEDSYGPIHLSKGVSPTLSQTQEESFGLRFGSSSIHRPEDSSSQASSQMFTPPAQPSPSDSRHERSISRAPSQLSGHLSRLNEHQNLMTKMNDQEAVTRKVSTQVEECTTEIKANLSELRVVKSSLQNSMEMQKEALEHIQKTVSSTADRNCQTILHALQDQSPFQDLYNSLRKQDNIQQQMNTLETSWKLSRNGSESTVKQHHETVISAISSVNTYISTLAAHLDSINRRLDLSESHNRQIITVDNKLSEMQLSCNTHLQRVEEEIAHIASANRQQLDNQNRRYESLVNRVIAPPRLVPIKEESSLESTESSPLESSPPKETTAQHKRKRRAPLAQPTVYSLTEEVDLFGAVIEDAREKKDTNKRRKGQEGKKGEGNTKKTAREEKTNKKRGKC